MPQDDIAAQWKSFDSDKRDRLLKKMSPEQKKKLRGMLEAKPITTPGEAKAAIAPDRFSQDLDITEKWAEGHPILGPIARFAVTAGQNAANAITNTPGAVYHSFADPATPSEIKRYGADQVTGAKRIGLGVGRVLGREQAEDAIDEYKSGKVTPSGAAAVLPEALGTGVGQVAGGSVYGKVSEIGGEGLSTVGKLRQKMQPVARQITGVEPALKEAVTKAADKYGDDIAAHKVKHAETIKDNLRTQAEARTAIDRQKMAVAEKNKGIEAENKAQAEKVSQRTELAKNVDIKSKELGEHLSKVEQSVAKEANAKFDKVREKVGNPQTDPAELVSLVKNIETDTLQNIPENIKEFRAILKSEDLPNSVKGAAEKYAATQGFELEGPEPMTWDKLQALKSRIELRLRKSSGMLGSVKYGLYQLQDGVVGTMGKMAEEHGATAEWKDARDTWRQYKEDFHESSGPSGSASPVARALNAEDPKNIRQPFLSTKTNIPQAGGAFENRGTTILRKYPQHGGTEAAAHVDNLLASHQQMLDLPAKESPKALKPTPEVFQLPENKPMPKPPEAPTVDASKVARDAIAQRAKNWGSFNARDVGIIASSVLFGPIQEILGNSKNNLGAMNLIPGAALAYEGGKFASSRYLNSPKVIEWLSKTPPEEAAALARIPGADKVKIVDGLTQAAVQGKVRNLSPAARSLLGPTNVARVLAAIQDGQPKNRKEALEKLGRSPDPVGNVP